MFYGRYSREARRWITAWPLPSEIIARGKIEADLRLVEVIEPGEIPEQTPEGIESDAEPAEHSY